MGERGWKVVYVLIETRVEVKVREREREVVDWMVEGAGDCGMDIGQRGRQVVNRIGE